MCECGSVCVCARAPPPALTSAVLFAPMLWHADMAVDDRLGLQNILVVTVARGCPFVRCATGACLVAVVISLVDLGEESLLVKQGQVPLKVKVCVQAYVQALPETLLVPQSQMPSHDAVLPTVLLWRGLRGPSAVGGICRN